MPGTPSDKHPGTYSRRLKPVAWAVLLVVVVALVLVAWLLPSKTVQSQKTTQDARRTREQAPGYAQPKP